MSSCGHVNKAIGVQLYSAYNFEWQGEKSFDQPKLF